MTGIEKHSSRKRLAMVLMILLLSGCVCRKINDQQLAIRNVILIIGDGMGYPAVGLLRSYARYAPESIYSGQNGICALEQAMVNGRQYVQFTEPYGVLVTDSAASGTQLAGGKPALTGVIGGDHLGNPVETILEAAKKHGKTTALVSDTRITHATPAVFAAHVADRGMEDTIAEQLIQSKTRPDIMFSAGLHNFLPLSFNDPESDIHRRLISKWNIDPRIRSKRTDDRDLLAEAETEGRYAVVLDRAALEKVDKPPVLGLFASAAMPDAIVEKQERDNPSRQWPTLDEMTLRALELASTNPKGFFLMVEAGQIDWAAHYNDAGMLLNEMIRLDLVIEAVYTWAKGRDDTVIIITADHDTGGYAMAYADALNPPEPVVLPGPLFSGSEYVPSSDYGDYAVLDKLYNQRIGASELIIEFLRLDDTERTPEKLAAMVNDRLDITLSPADAERIMRERPDPFPRKRDSQTDIRMVPDMGDSQIYYRGYIRMLCGLLARKTGIGRNITWSCGTHTAAPVPLIVLGPKSVQDLFSSVMHSTDTGKAMIRLVSAE